MGRVYWADYVPPAGLASNFYDTGWYWASWRMLVMPYCKNVQIFQCPSYERPDEGMWGYTPDWGAGIVRSYAGCHSWAHDGYAASGRKMADTPRPSTSLLTMESRYEYADLGTWTLPWRAWLDNNKGAYTSHNGQCNWSFMDGHAKAMKPQRTFGALAWANGEVPDDDFLWEWWTGPESTVLRGWQNECSLIPEYR